MQRIGSETGLGEEGNISAYDRHCSATQCVSENDDADSSNADDFTRLWLPFTKDMVHFAAQMVTAGQLP